MQRSAVTTTMDFAGDRCFAGAETVPSKLVRHAVLRDGTIREGADHQLMKLIKVPHELVSLVHIYIKYPLRGGANMNCMGKKPVKSQSLRPNMIRAGLTFYCVSKSWTGEFFFHQ